MKQFLIVVSLVIAALIPGGRAVSARQDHPKPVRSVLVQRGDTLWGIAGEHVAGDRRQAVFNIMKLNALRSPVVQPGQRLMIPA